MAFQGMTDTIRVAKPPTIEEIPTDRSSIVEASAGTGKTYTLEHLIVELVVEEETPIQNILVVTFTERATAELVERVRAIFERMVEREEGDDVDDGEPHWVIDPPARRRLRDALFSFDRAPIYTIHGFCQRVLVEHAFANRRPFEQEVADSDELFDEAFHRALREDFSATPVRTELLESYLESNSLRTLRSTLGEAIGTTDAVAPSFDADRAASILREIRPTIREMDGRLREAADEGELWTGRETKMLRYLDAFAAGYEAMDRGDARLFPVAFGSELEGNDEPPGEYFEDPSFLTKSSERLYDETWPRAVGRLSEIELTPVGPVLDEFVPLVDRHLEELKTDEGVFTYDDMLAHVERAVSGDGNDGLVSTLREEYQYALVDEFQDTDPTQWSIFRKLFHRSEGTHPCVLIGDPKQAIYGFRGADVRTYFEARDEVADDDGDNLVRLPDNYRSSEQLIDAYNRILGPDAENGFFRPPNEYEEPVGCGNSKIDLTDGEGESVDPVVVTRMTAAGEDDFDASGYRGGLARAWAREIRELLGSAGRGNLQIWDDDEGELRPLEASDIYVLTRSRREGDLMADHLRAMGVPHAFYKREGLFQTPQAVDWYHLLRAVQRPGDRSRRLKAWTTPFFGLEIDEAADAEEAVEEGHELADRLNRWNELADAGRIGQLVHRVLDGTGLLRRQVFAQPGERELTNYEHLAEVFVDWAQSDDLALDEIAARLRRYIEEEATPEGQEGDLQRLETEREAVQIMTMHKAKGLSAGVVFVFGGYEFNSQPPHRYYEESDGESRRVLYFGSKNDHGEAIVDYKQEEAERLLYVAMTRAEGRLYVPWATPEDHGGDLSRRKSPMGALFDRLDALIDDPEEPPAKFDVRTRSVDPRPPRRIEPASEDDESVLERRIRRAARELEVPGDLDVDEDRFGRLRAERRLFVESYSSVRRFHHAEEDEPEEREADDLAERADADETDEPDEPEGPPPGRVTGLCLHQLLEDLDPATIVEAEGFEWWRRESDVAELFDRIPAHFGLQGHRDEFERLAWRAMTTPIDAPEVSLPAIASVDRQQVEMEFWYPIPESGAPTIDELVAADGVAPRPTDDGYLRGFIDLLFEEEGRIYLADWKSNWLRGEGAYASDAIAEVVEDRYAVQARFYTTAVARMIARSVDSREELEERLGGLFYFFVRGMEPSEAGEPTPGVYFDRPDLAELQSWEERAGREVAEMLGAKRSHIASGRYDRWQLVSH
ncbi:MAG: UvrD-helicase domain-containing protein [Bradymonadaceae bacterium]